MFISKPWIHLKQTYPMTMAGEIIIKIIIK